MFLAAVLSQPLSWQRLCESGELGQSFCLYNRVPLPRATQQHGTTSCKMQLEESGWKPGTGVERQWDPGGAMQR